MEGHPPTESESTSSVLRDHGGGPSVENQVKVAFAANHTFAKSEEVLSVKEPMEVGIVLTQTNDLTRTLLRHLV